MQRVFYPLGTKLGKEIFSFLPDSECIPYAGSDLESLKQEKGDVLVANTRLNINEATIREYSHFSIFATVSSGTDHVDFSALEKLGKEFMNSPGSNASSVAEYVWVAIRHRFTHPDSSYTSSPIVGIVGMGNVGKKLSQLLDQHSILYRYYDPAFLNSNTWEETIQSNIVSFHVPLTKTKSFDGIEPTCEFFDLNSVRKIPRGGILLNTSRGEIIHPSALDYLLERDDINLVLDVFHPEPVNQETANQLLRKKNSIYTPHIAGYSQIGRVQGTYQLAQKLARRVGKIYPKKLEDFLKKDLEWKTDTFLEEESQLLKNSWLEGDWDYFERRRNHYPLRLDL